MIYTELYSALVKAGRGERASHVLVKFSDQIDMMSVCADKIDDQAEVDEAMIEAFSKVFISLQKEQRERQIALGLAKQKYLSMYEGDYF